MNKVARKVKTALAIAVCAGSVVVGAGAAHAASGSFVESVPGASARVNWETDGYRSIQITLQDTAPNDRSCARVYTRGYQFPTWSAWSLKGTACAGETKTLPRDNVYWYDQHQEVKVCNGTGTGAASCDVKRAW